MEAIPWIIFSGGRIILSWTRRFCKGLRPPNEMREPPLTQSVSQPAWRKPLLSFPRGKCFARRRGRKR